MINHRVERRRVAGRDVLRVTLELDLPEVQTHIPLPDPPHENPYYRRVLQYCLHRIVPDVFEVGQILKDESEEGSVKWFDERKGYGFIRTYDGQDVFVHHRGIAGEGFKSLQQGQKVRFKRREGRETIEAFDVEPV